MLINIDGVNRVFDIFLLMKASREEQSNTYETAIEYILKNGKGINLANLLTIFFIIIIQVSDGLLWSSFILNTRFCKRTASGNCSG